MNLETACRELVERGRLGDQNAIATMAKVTENAKKGDPKAQKSHDIMLRYARYTENDKPARGPEITGPLQTALASLRDGIRKVRNKLDYVKHVRLTVPQVGVSFRDAANSAQAVSKGPEINDTTLQAIADTFTTDSAKSGFAAAVSSGGNLRALADATSTTGDAQDKNALQMGFVMGLARRMQVVRAGGPIAAYSKLAAWELGEV